MGCSATGRGKGSVAWGIVLVVVTAGCRGTTPCAPPPSPPVIELVATPASKEESAHRWGIREGLRRMLEWCRGWELHETPHYFVVTSVEDPAFLSELSPRLQGMLAFYQREIPVSLPDVIGVVRVCRDEEEYSGYGGPSGSHAYFYWVEEELVFHDRPPPGDRENAWATLRGIGFSQYLFNVARTSAHPWYRTGMGAFFAGCDHESGRLVLTPHEGYEARFRALRDADRLLRLADLTRMSAAEFRAGSRDKWSYHDGVAQSWSLVWYFKMAGRQELLDLYTRALVETENAEEAQARLDEAVDWQEVEESWSAWWAEP